MRQINPSGKISLFPKPKSPLDSPHPVPRQGALAIVTERWDGMRWTRRDRARNGIAGRVNSVSSPGTCGRAVSKRTAKACGPDSLRVGVKSCGGAKSPTGLTCQIPQRRRRQQSQILRGERVISRKAIAQGMSDVLRCPVCSCAVFYSCILHTRSRVQRASDIPCSLSFEGQRYANLGQIVPRERGRVHLMFRSRPS
jgi:hypothetical protein